MLTSAILLVPYRSKKMRLRSRHSLATKLLATYLLALLVTTGLVAAVVDSALSLHAEEIQPDLQAEVDLLARSLKFDAAGRPQAFVLPGESSWIYRAWSADLKYRLVDSAGVVRLSSESAGGPLAPDGRVFDPGLAAFALSVGGLRLQVRTVAITKAGTTYYVQAASSDRISAFGKILIGNLLLGATLRLFVLSLLVLSAVVYYTLWRVLRPLRETSEAAARIEPGNLSTRLATERIPPEFAPLIDAFNLALDRVEKGYRLQQEFLSGAAHELKTPLALIRAQIEVNGTTDRTVLLRDLDFMARQIHQLLHLAEVSESKNYNFQSSDIAAIADDVVDYLGPLARGRGVRLDLRCAPRLPVIAADRSALFMLLKNLIENAIQHSPSDGIVAVAVDPTSLRIRDAGQGIAAEDLPKLFTRFWRGRARNTDGAGLGLAICQEIAIAHRWRISARDTGRGAEFELTFKG